jgi:hypothetical protein
VQAGTEALLVGTEALLVVVLVDLAGVLATDLRGGGDGVGWEGGLLGSEQGREGSSGGEGRRCGGGGRGRGVRRTFLVLEPEGAVLVHLDLGASNCIGMMQRIGESAILYGR